MDSPLQGIRVLDFSRLVPGPYCTLLLSELGAEVIKVEDARGGDPLRHMPPLADGVGVIFAALNRGKQSVALDLKQDDGRMAVHALAKRCDVVVEGFRPGVAHRLGIDFETLAGHNPRLVYCSISGYGQQGEWRDLTGHDLTYAAMTGLLDALSPGEPRVPGVQLVDAAASLLAAMRILAALHGSGVGPQYLDVTLAQGAQALMPLITAKTLSGQANGPWLVEVLRGSARNNLYRCADGRWLALTPLEDWFWEDLHSTLRSAALLAANEMLTEQRLAEIFSQRPCEEWFALLAGAGIPCAPVRTVDEVAQDVTTAPGFGLPGVRAAPQLGADTAVWLQALGYPEGRIAQLAERRVILTGAPMTSHDHGHPGS